ncbi:MAG: dienelactone hydrolase family protein [Gammaproteobacteria bacterium]|nr:dienelactone hydrolase family protein [Gammaproteobacteria bacterium]
MSQSIQLAEQQLTIPYKNIILEGILAIPKNALGLILFAHGSGSSRFSKRNQYVARVLNQAKWGTLLFDLLTHDENTIDNRTAEFRFDINLLAARLENVTQWCLNNPQTSGLMMGYFGASTGAAAALIAATQQIDLIKAIVSRGGRPDLANHALYRVTSPTLLIVGERDEAVIKLNQNALDKMSCIKQLEIIPDATHLFEEPGTLEKVAEIAQAWFLRYLN